MLFTIAEGKRALRIFLREAAPDNSYGLRVRPDWNTKTTVVNKKPIGFTIRFQDPAPPEGGVVNIDVPGFNIYSAEQMVHQVNRQVQRARDAMQVNRDAMQVNRETALAREMEVPLQMVQRVRRERLAVINASNREVQTRLVPAAQRGQRVKKKKVDRDARLKALVNASIGG